MLRLPEGQHFVIRRNGQIWQQYGSVHRNHEVVISRPGENKVISRQDHACGTRLPLFLQTLSWFVIFAGAILLKLPNRQLLNRPLMIPYTHAFVYASALECGPGDLLLTNRKGKGDGMVHIKLQTCLMSALPADSSYCLLSLFIFMPQAAIGRDTHVKELRPNNPQWTESYQQQWECGMLPQANLQMNPSSDWHLLSSFEWPWSRGPN